MEKIIQDFKYLKMASTSESTTKLKSRFLEVYSVLKSDLLQDPAIGFTHVLSQWANRMLDYNVPGGENIVIGHSCILYYFPCSCGHGTCNSTWKLNRGLCVVDSYKVLTEGKELTEDEIFLASVLGWCIEWGQAAALILDDIMDSSHTRRGQPCWFRVPEVGKIAVNNAVVIQSQVHRILKSHFREKPYYVDILDLFSEVEFQTNCGQMLDVITTHEGKKDLSKFTISVHNHIVKYKTSYYSFYLPVACALLMAGENLENHINLKDILVEMGIYFQVQDDYLDCFGDPDKMGKIGTDIEEFKCSWLVVKALENCNEEQKQMLYEHYGKADPADVAKIKKLYNDLDLQGVFAEYEAKIHHKLTNAIDAHPSKPAQAVLKSFLDKIYKRQK